LYFIKDSLTTTSYIHHFENSGHFYWKVIAYSSDSTYTESNIFNFVLILTDNNDGFLSPLEFKLNQNYPNPFNPNTIISWQSPVSDIQTIKLFDTLGREIETIVDGYYGAGKHSKLYIVNSSLPSGIYFYQLRVGNYSETKKMILIR
jgi:hypothetical protein